MNDKKKGLFAVDHPFRESMINWWEGLKQNKGDRAELRRCKDLKEIQQASSFQRIYWKMMKLAGEENNPSKEQMAIIIGLAAHIEGNDDSECFGHQISRGAESPILSELRFRKLLRINDRQGLFRFLIQVIRILDKRVNLLDLQEISYFWGEDRKTKLSYKYYEKAVLKK